MAERPDYEKGIALLSAPARVVRAATEVVAGPLAVGGNATVYFQPTTGKLARLVGLRIACPLAAVAPASGALVLTINIGTINRAVACFGFAQWGATAAMQIWFLWSMPIAGPLAIPITNTYAVPSVYCYPAATGWWEVLKDAPMTAGDRLTINLYNGTNQAGRADNYFNVQVLLDEEAIS